MRGCVNWFNRGRGYGMIFTQTGERIFVHYSGLDNPGHDYVVLYAGEIVEYDDVEVVNGNITAKGVRLSPESIHDRKVWERKTSEGGHEHAERYSKKHSA